MSYLQRVAVVLATVFLVSVGLSACDQAPAPEGAAPASEEKAE